MESAGKGLCVAGLIMAIIGAFVPLIGLFIGWAALGLATMGALAGNKGTAIAVVAVSAMVFLFLTPSLWLEAVAHGSSYGQSTGSSPILKIGTLIMLAAPLVAMFLRKGGEVASGK
ncbi:MAG: hypothetical protein AAGL23_01455 [Pseudomonadota bacterium]